MMVVPVFMSALYLPDVFVKARLGNMERKSHPTANRLNTHHESPVSSVWLIKKSLVIYMQAFVCAQEDPRLGSVQFLSTPKCSSD